VLGIDNATHFIEDLRSSWLISEVVPDRYAFHPLLREFLRRRFEQDAPHQFHELSRGVAAWAFTVRDWEEFFAQAKAIEVKGNLVEGITSAASELLNAGKIETLERYIAMCGTENELLPEIRLARAEVLYRRGSFGEAQALAEEVAQSISGPSDLLSSAWYLAGRAANLRSLPRASRVLHGRAEASAVSVQCQSDARWGSFLASVEMEEEVEEWRARLHELSASSDRSRARSLIADGMVFCFKGKPRLATKSLATALRIIDRLHDPVLHTNALVQLAFSYFMRSEYLASCDRAREAITLANRFRLEFVVPYAETVLALSLTARGDHDAAHRHLAIIAADPDPYFRATSLWVKGRIFAHELKLRSVLDIVEELPREAPAYLRARVGSLGVLAAVSLQENDRARSMRDDLCARTTDGYALAVADLALMSSARLAAEASESALERLFSSLLADELFDPIVLVTRVRPEVEALLGSTVGGRHTLDELFARARAELDLGPLGGARNLPARISALTPRELEVLDLLELGCSNRDIAQRLVISEATAKVHVRNVIRKLGVRTRLQAALVRRGSSV
jgi:ATP/maltotriose-dependent transcriptional regulator MalT